MFLQVDTIALRARYGRPRHVLLAITVELELLKLLLTKDLMLISVLKAIIVKKGRMNLFPALKELIVMIPG